MKSLRALLLLLPMTASADPGAATRYLMNEPASMLDIGIVRIAQDIEVRRIYVAEQYAIATSTANVLVTTSADYSYDDDNVRIHFYIGTDSSRNAENGCRNLVADLGPALKSLVLVAFTHHGYTTSGYTEDLSEQIVRRTEILCWVRNLATEENVLYATSNLSDLQVSVTLESSDED